MLDPAEKLPFPAPEKRENICRIVCRNLFQFPVIDGKSGSKYFREPYVLAAGGIAYLMLSTMQAWWQTVALWVIKCRIKSKNLRINDYPDWVGGGAWVFYWLKMIVITVTSIYAIVKLNHN